MRGLFTVGVRLIGVVSLYWALKHIPTMFAVFSALFIDLPATVSYNPWWELMLVVVSFAVSLGFAVVLLFAGDRILGRIPLLDTPIPQGPVSSALLLRTGVVASGLILGGLALPRLLVELYVMAFPGGGGTSTVATVYGAIRPMESALQVALACVVLFRAEWLVGLFENDKATEQAGAADAAQGPRG